MCDRGTTSNLLFSEPAPRLRTLFQVLARHVPCNRKGVHDHGVQLAGVTPKNLSADPFENISPKGANPLNKQRESCDRGDVAHYLTALLVGSFGNVLVIRNFARDCSQLLDPSGQPNGSVRGDAYFTERGGSVQTRWRE